MPAYDDETSKLPAWICCDDAAADSRDNIALWDNDTKALAQHLREMLVSAYIRSRTFLNYRQKFILVKVERVQAADKCQSRKEIAAIEQFCEKHDIRIKESRGHRLFEVKEQI